MNTKRDIVLRPSWRLARAVVVTGLLALCWGFIVDAALGGSMYSYVNDEGAVVVTDDLKKVPERYRKRVKVTEGKEQAADKAASFIPQVVSRAQEKVSGWKLPLPDTIMPGFTNYQSAVLIGGFVIAALVFAIMTLSRSPAIKFAMKWALMFVVVGMVYALYFSQLEGLSSEGSQRTGGPTTRPAALLDKVKHKARGIERIQQRRADQVDEMSER